MQTVTTLPILQTVSDVTQHYISLQPAISGRTAAEYVNRNLSFNPASNTLNIAVNVNFLPNSISGLAIADSGIISSKIAPLTRLIEQAKIIPGQLSGNINIDVLESSVYYLTQYPTGALTFNLRGNTNYTLDRLLNPGQSVSTVFMITQNVTQQVANVSVDGNFQTANIRYGSNTKPTSTSISREVIDVYSFVTMKLATNSYIILQTQSSYGVG
jgi:hypothetical protein